jgi:uncharacterized protein (DUF885 family)
MTKESEQRQITKIEHDVYVSIKEHFEALMQDQQRQIDQIRKDASEAITKASTALEKRLDLLNEFRGQAAEESRRFLPRLEYDQNHQSMRETVDSLGTQVARLYGGLAVVAILGVTNLVRLFFAH